MQREKLKGKAQTVLGLVDGNELGFTLPHEHLFFDCMAWYVKPDDPDDEEIGRQPVTLENLSWVRSHSTSSLDNLHLTDEKATIGETMRFKKAGGNTIVNVTPNNVERHPTWLVNVARVTGINVIMGTAYYIEPSFKPEMGMDAKTDEDFTNEFVRDITTGVGDSGIRAGVIGEIGCSWPLTKNERKVLNGAAVAQQKTGAAISVHFMGGDDENPPFEVVKMLTNAGADPGRIIMGHMTCELPVSAHRARARLAEMGCYLEFDMFGNDGIYPLETPPFQEVPANDFIRISEIIDLIAGGYLNNILISHDVAMKIQQSCYGGMSYTHIPKTIIPMMRKRGLTEEQIHTITVENPRRIFSFV